MKMKKLLSVVLCMMLFVYALPLLTVGLSPDQDTDALAPEDTGEEVPTSADETLPEPASGWDKAHTVTVCIDGDVETLDFRTYLIGVMAAEMPASFPVEALKAQAVVARTYTLYKQELYGADGMPESHHGAQLCTDSNHCEAWCDVATQAVALWGDSMDFYLEKIAAAVDETDGLILVYQDQPIAAVFHSASAERTESAVDVWGTEVPYLVSVESPGGEDSPKYEGEVRISQKEFAAALLAQVPEADLSVDASYWFRDSHRSEAGGVIDVLVGGARVKGTLIRQIAGLNSINFHVQAEGDDLIFTTLGSGHGVGMSQYGARAMAHDGANYVEILLHYYSGAQLLKKSV